MDEKIDDIVTVEDFVKNKIDIYSKEVSEKINEKGIKEKMKLFLKNLTEIKIEPYIKEKI